MIHTLRNGERSIAAEHSHKHLIAYDVTSTIVKTTLGDA